MFLFFLTALVGMALPYLLYRVVSGCTQQIYDGPASVIPIGLLGDNAREKGFDYYQVVVPGHNSPVLLRVETSRMQNFGATAEVVVTVNKPLIGEAYVASVIWPGESRVEHMVRDGGAIFLSVCFMLTGMFSLVYLPLAGGVWQHIMLYGTAGMIAAAGYVAIAFSKPSGKDDIGESRFLFIPLGRGIRGLVVMTTLCVAINAAIFWTPSLLLLIGLNTAFAMGSCVAMLQRALQR
jgi:hypothetical protein